MYQSVGFTWLAYHPPIKNLPGGVSYTPQVLRVCSIQFEQIYGDYTLSELSANCVDRHLQPLIFIRLQKSRRKVNINMTYISIS